MKIKSSYFLAASTTMLAFLSIMTYIADEPVSTSLLLLAATVGWLITQIRLEKLTGE